MTGRFTARLEAGKEFGGGALVATMPKVSDAMKRYARLWVALCSSLGDAGMSQTDLLRNDEYIPKGVVDFDEFVKYGLNTVFTSEKIVTKIVKGDHNTLGLMRDVRNGNVAIPVLGSNGCVLMIPLGAPGAVIGGSPAHLICVKASLEGGPVTLNEMLPTTPEETADFEMRLGLFEQAYKNLHENVPVSECGHIVMAKATKLGLDPTVRIRDFVVAAIAAVDKGEGVRPGFVLRDRNGVDIAGDSDAVKNMIYEVFGRPIKFRTFIQAPTDVSVVFSHIHAFIEQVFPKELHDTYVDCIEILVEKKRLLAAAAKAEEEAAAAPEPQPEGDDGTVNDGAALCRTTTVMKPTCG